MKLNRKHKILEATETEMYSVYLEHEWFEIYTFPDYLTRCVKHGTKIIEEVKGSKE